MSTDGTKPPSIAPKKPRTSTRTASGSARAGGATTGEQAGTRSVTPPLSGDAAPSVGIKRSGDSGGRTSGSTATVQLADAPPSTSPATLPRTTEPSSSAS